MRPVLSLELFGHSLPKPGLALVLIVLAALFFLANRGGGLVGDDSERMGTGIERECPRCGRRFHPEHVEVLSSGDVRRFHDERCPGCGWDYDWGHPKPGGAGGGW